jgi:hypothetical protein
MSRTERQITVRTFAWGTHEEEGSSNFGAGAVKPADLRKSPRLRLDSPVEGFAATLRAGPLPREVH